MTTRRLLLVDFIGACLSASMLALVLPLSGWSGLPRPLLFVLAAIAACLAAHAFVSHRRASARHERSLRAAATLNLLYCCVTAIALVVYWDALTVLDLVYFPAEMVIVVALAFVETRTASNAWPGSNS